MVIKVGLDKVLNMTSSQASSRKIQGCLMKIVRVFQVSFGLEGRRIMCVGFFILCFKYI